MKENVQKKKSLGKKAFGWLKSPICHMKAGDAIDSGNKERGEKKEKEKKSLKVTYLYLLRINCKLVSWLIYFMQSLTLVLISEKLDIDISNFC